MELNAKSGVLLADTVRLTDLHRVFIFNNVETYDYQLDFRALSSASISSTRSCPWTLCAAMMQLHPIVVVGNILSP